MCFGVCNYGLIPSFLLLSTGLYAYFAENELQLYFAYVVDVTIAKFQTLEYLIILKFKKFVEFDLIK